MSELQHACGALGEGGMEEVASTCRVSERLESGAKSQQMLRLQILRRHNSMAYPAYRHCTFHSRDFLHVQHPRTLVSQT